MSHLTTADLADSFRRAGIGGGDVLMLHADALVLAQLPPMSSQQRFQCLFDALDQVLGPDGTLVMPVFTYSFTKGEIFDPATTPSTVGALTDYFRTLPGVRRSSDPIFSVAARGRLADDFAAVPVQDCFGPQSAFALLDRHDARLACLGCSFDRITYTHYVEQKAQVDYRYFKTFSGTLIRDGQPVAAETRYFVRDVDRQTAIDLSRLRAHLTDQGLLTTVAVGRVGLCALPCRVFEEQARQLMARQPNSLIAEGKA